MLYIVTVCQQPNNLSAIHSSIPTKARWIVCYDENIMLSQMNNTTLLPYKNVDGRGVKALNYVLDSFEFSDDDHILYNSDRNIIHPHLYDSVSPLLNNDFSVLQWGQIHKDGVIRLPPMPYCIPGSLDLASFLIKWKLNKNVRFSDIDDHHVYYAMDCCKNGPLAYISNYLCYYNYLG